MSDYYSTIYNPYTQQMLSLRSREGIALLKQYARAVLSLHQSGGKKNVMQDPIVSLRDDLSQKSSDYAKLYAKKNLQPDPPRMA